MDEQPNVSGGEELECRRMSTCSSHSEDDYNGHMPGDYTNRNSQAFTRMQNRNSINSVRSMSSTTIAAAAAAAAAATFAKTFPEKLMDMLESPTASDSISWLPHGKSFSITNPNKFTSDVLPHYFKRSKFKSFTRKLYRWGFRQITKGSDSGSYYHEHFERGNLDCARERMHCQYSERELKTQAENAAAVRGRRRSSYASVDSNTNCSLDKSVGNTQRRASAAAMLGGGGKRASFSVCGGMTTASRAVRRSSMLEDEELEDSAIDEEPDDMVMAQIQRAAAAFSTRTPRSSFVAAPGGTGAAGRRTSGTALLGGYGDPLFGRRFSRMSARSSVSSAASSYNFGDPSKRSPAHCTNPSGGLHFRSSSNKIGTSGLASMGVNVGVPLNIVLPNVTADSPLPKSDTAILSNASVGQTEGNWINTPVTATANNDNKIALPQTSTPDHISDEKNNNTLLQQGATTTSQNGCSLSGLSLADAIIEAHQIENAMLQEMTLRRQCAFLANSHDARLAALERQFNEQGTDVSTANNGGGGNCGGLDSNTVQENERLLSKIRAQALAAQLAMQQNAASGAMHGNGGVDSLGFNQQAMIRLRDQILSGGGTANLGFDDGGYTGGFANGGVGGAGNGLGGVGQIGLGIGIDGTGNMTTKELVDRVLQRQQQQQTAAAAAAAAFLRSNRPFGM